MRREGEDVAGAIVGHLARYDGGHLQRVDDRHCHVYLKPSSTLSRSLRSLGKIGKILGTDFYLTEYDTCQTVAIFYTSYGQSILGNGGVLTNLETALFEGSVLPGVAYSVMMNLPLSMAFWYASDFKNRFFILTTSPPMTLNDVKMDKPSNQ